MRERIKKFIALLMSIIVINQLPGFEALVVCAATNELYTNYSLTSDSEYTHVFKSGGVTLTIESGVNVAGVELSTVGYVNTVDNNGAVNAVTVSSGELNLNGGYYGNVSLTEGGIINASNVSVGTLNAYGAIYFEGDNSANYFTAQYPSGNGTLTVSDELTLDETQAGVTVSVNRNTVINAPTYELSLYYNGTLYTVPAGSIGTSLAEEYGVYVTIESVDDRVSWESVDGTGEMDSYLMPGDSTGKYKITAAEGYYFPDDYATKVEFGGSGSNSFDYISDTEVQVSYTVSEYDSEKVIITFPTPEKLILDGEGTFSVADIAYGGTLNPQYTSSTQITTVAIVEYKVSGAEDTTYSTTAPTAVGSYTARVTIPTDEDNYELVMTDDFAITRAAGEGKLSVADSYYGEIVSPELSSGTNSVSGVVVEYKTKGASDLTYSKTVPTAVGNYVARATLPETDTHTGVTVTDEFSIAYMPVPDNGYSLLGTMGSNNYYTSSVTVVAKEGYAISRTLDGEYVGQFTIDASSSGAYVYFMNEATGAKSAGVLMTTVNIDVTSPSIDANNTETYYADSLAVSISDSNLANVTVNGEAVVLSGNSTVLNLKSDGGVEEYQIVVTDLAGNIRNIKVTVAAEWTKTGEIPSGSLVKLQAGKTYTLGAGTWTVSGDSTTYNGGTVFFVGGEGQYTFNQN